MSEAYRSEIDRCLSVLHDSEMQTRSRVRRERERRSWLEGKQPDSQSVIDYFLYLVQQERARMQHNTRMLELETERLTKLRGPGALFPCKVCGDYCTVPGYITEPYGTPKP